ncbi:MAG TPA: AIR synthase-related protein, partial [Solirubrobacteraceae bacterium]|nr:AIR synthase-related protein [Solirubrobacteraceae bacterium]
AATLDAIRDAVRAGELSSAHDIAEGGFLVAVAESALAGGLGAALDLGDADAHSDPRPGASPAAAAAGGDATSERVSVSLDELARAHARLAELFT